MRPIGQPGNPEIVLADHNGEITLYIDGNQAMQAWEHDLMVESADLLCQYGCEFLEVGLGLGISALRIAQHPNTRTHVVWEKYRTVIDLFNDRHPNPSPVLRIEQADFFESSDKLTAASLDGIFFDPWLPREIADDECLWAEVMPRLVRALRPGGVLIPFFSTQPVLKWPFRDYFSKVIVERRCFQAYPATKYTHGTAGQACNRLKITCPQNLRASARNLPRASTRRRPCFADGTIFSRLLPMLSDPADSRVGISFGPQPAHNARSS